MSQTTKDYQYDRNDNNTFGVRGTASGGGTEVEANPEGTATADLTKLKVDDTIYGVPVGYPIHTYQANKTYTSSDTDYEQLRDDITKGRIIKVNDYGADNTTYYTLNHTMNLTNVVYYYQAIYNSTNTGASIKGITITVSSSNVVISSEAYFGVERVGTDIGYASTIKSKLIIGSGEYSFLAKSTRALDTAPTADNTDGGIQLVVLTSEPATYYNGYYYIIAPTT